MKSLVILSVVLVALPLVLTLSDDEIKYLTKLANRCANKTQSPDSDVKHLIDKDRPIERSTKCLYACMYELFGIVRNLSRQISSF